MRLGILRGLELIDRASAENLGIVYHVDAELDETTGQLVGLSLLARKGWLGSRRQRIPWGAVETIGKELIIVNLAVLTPAADVPATETARPLYAVAPRRVRVLPDDAEATADLPTVPAAATMEAPAAPPWSPEQLRRHEPQQRGRR